MEQLRCTDISLEWTESAKHVRKSRRIVEWLWISAGATKTACQVASLTAFKSGTPEAPHNVTSHQGKIGT